MKMEETRNQILVNGNCTRTRDLRLATIQQRQLIAQLLRAGRLPAKVKEVIRKKEGNILTTRDASLVIRYLIATLRFRTAFIRPYNHREQAWDEDEEIQQLADKEFVEACNREGIEPEIKLRLKAEAV